MAIAGKHCATHTDGLNSISNKKDLAPRTGFEPVTHGLEGRCSIQLSYRGSDLKNR